MKNILNSTLLLGVAWRVRGKEWWEILKEKYDDLDTKQNWYQFFKEKYQTLRMESKLNTLELLLRNNDLKNIQRLLNTLSPKEELSVRLKLVEPKEINNKLYRPVREIIEAAHSVEALQILFDFGICPDMSNPTMAFSFIFHQRHDMLRLLLGPHTQYNSNLACEVEERRKAFEHLLVESPKPQNQLDFQEYIEDAKVIIKTCLEIKPASLPHLFYYLYSKENSNAIEFAKLFFECEPKFISQLDIHKTFQGCIRNNNTELFIYLLSFLKEDKDFLVDILEKIKSGSLTGDKTTNSTLLQCQQLVETLYDNILLKEEPFLLSMASQNSVAKEKKVIKI